MEFKSVIEIVSSDSEYDVVEGLTSWEVINPSDDDVDFAYSSSSDDEIDTTVSDYVDGEDVIGPKEGSPDINGPQVSGICLTTLNYLFALEAEEEEKDPGADRNGLSNYLLAPVDDEEEEDDFDGYYDEYDLDDELVPKSVRGKFGRERIKKLGKRGGRMKASKKLPHYYNRPGCVYGKHGLGVQHSCI